MKKIILVCAVCGRRFKGVNATTCPRCRQKRLSEIAKSRNLNKIGVDARCIKCVGTDTFGHEIEFPSINAAVVYVGGSPGGINRYCQGAPGTYKGYTWRYSNGDQEKKNQQQR
jgi:hypothetical protein